jgi:hypothetical protein
MAIGAKEAFCSVVLDSILRRCTELFPVSSSFEWHHSVDRSEFSISSVCRHRDIVTAKQRIVPYLLFVFPKCTLIVFLRRSAPLFQLLFNKEG